MRRWAVSKITTAPLRQSEIAAIRRVIGSDPPSRAAVRLGIDRHTLLRAVAGYDLRAGSACQLRLIVGMADGQEPRP